MRLVFLLRRTVWLVRLVSCDTPGTYVSFSLLLRRRFVEGGQTGMGKQRPGELGGGRKFGGFRISLGVEGAARCTPSQLLIVVTVKSFRLAPSAAACTAPCSVFTGRLFRCYDTPHNRISSQHILHHDISPSHLPSDIISSC